MNKHPIKENICKIITGIGRKNGSCHQNTTIHLNIPNSWFDMYCSYLSLMAKQKKGRNHKNNNNNNSMKGNKTPQSEKLLLSFLPPPISSPLLQSMKDKSQHFSMKS